MINATSGRIHRVALAALLVLALVVTILAVSTSSQATPAHETETDNRVTRADLLSVSIPSVCGMRLARLVNGAHPDSGIYPSLDPSAAIFGHGFLTGAPEKSRIGDFTGEGVADGLIVVGCNQRSGSSYINSRVFAYRPNGRYLGHVPVARHVPPSWAPFEIGRVVIVDGTIRLQVWTFRPEDSHCCASVLTRLRFRWRNGSFRLVWRG